MFSNSYQSGFISIFFSVGSNPLALWDKQVKNGHIRRVIDDEVKSLVLDIGGTNVATTYITCPIKPRASLGVKLPYFVMVIKNMKKYFSFEIQILDDKDMRRRFRVSNFQSTTKVRPFCTTMPIGLSAGWNQVQFNLADFTKRAYGSAYIETVRVQIHANVRIRRIYFTDQLHSDEDLPNEFKLFAPGPRDKGKPAKESKKSSKEALDTQGEFSVPPIKAEPRPDEEIPPPPSPAEESPIAKDEQSEAAGRPQPSVEFETAVEGEHVAEEEETPVEVAPEVTFEGEEKAEEAPPAEGEEIPDEAGGAMEGDVTESSAVEGAEAVPEEVGESVEPTEGEAPDEGGEATAEGDGQVFVEGEPTEAVEQPAKDEAPPEGTAEDTVQASDTPVETGEVSEVAETEGSPSEPATEDSPSEPATEGSPSEPATENEEEV